MHLRYQKFLDEISDHFGKLKKDNLFPIGGNFSLFFSHSIKQLQPPFKFFLKLERFTCKNKLLKSSHV